MSKRATNKTKSYENLQVIEKDSFRGNYEATVIEQWKTCVETANGITEKRNTANSIFITVNTALFAVITFSLEYRSILLSAVGIFICVLWLRLLNNYRILNEVKYDIINEMEELLPLSPFKTEWARLQKGGKYTGLTKLEKALPIVFIVLYGLAILYPVLKLLLQIICPCVTN